MSNCKVATIKTKEIENLDDFFDATAYTDFEPLAVGPIDDYNMENVETMQSTMQSTMQWTMQSKTQSTMHDAKEQEHITFDDATD